MKELEIAISLALAGLRITPEQQIAISEAKFVDLVAEQAVDDVAEYLEYKMLNSMMHES